mmetsp:Transcript_25545/g.58930  ORF Transcript_25545/g.58930 Transcript_25545/m.58930 type:complete len:121 (-) Transcript_25545:376-738(-)|eukprot:CAMPEP_0113297604 /NCGR_PEP_ID=MMETSP0010_2-20120614/392_1 /TAXON_ID=216773 ORGANISM="Corethron hystrix, Strain 308" /NCGR_SAMPLE_ID=MMETSP0010_2 /ASSEMBLY_ACC=CAM_ASM_000155 /LENGTH=120 /DNA_ID=CAMNT_0000150511 /DNA_START=628 /DNA_END=990 /DNA_ORIENTATION=+ /assembly_acc=CAM_ASM_000155
MTEQPPKPTYVDSDEVSITVSFTLPATSPLPSYELEAAMLVESHGGPVWERSKKTPIAFEGDSEVIRATAEDLEPGMTYFIRLVATLPEGGREIVGDPLVIDTQAVGCAPSESKCRCIIS